MNKLTVTAKGQITLRKELLRHLGVRPGEKIIVDTLPDGRIEVRAEKATGKISDMFGMLKRPGQKPLSLAQIKKSIEQGWSRKQ
jgi:antitoxin PrlF